MPVSLCDGDHGVVQQRGSRTSRAKTGRLRALFAPAAAFGRELPPLCLTSAYDRGEKLTHYQLIPTLTAVIFVSHREPRITLVSRTAEGWTTQDFVPGERLVLQEVPVTLDVDRVYAGIQLDPA